MERKILHEKIVKQDGLKVVRNITFSNRIPRDYFITKGKGESDITIHAGSFHHALQNAGIEMCNIITYSSILPGVAKEIKKVNNLVHGSVMETIMAVANSTSGNCATAGITYGWLYSRKDKSKFGGLVCEYNGEKTDREARYQLRSSLQELYENGYSKNYELKNIKTITESFIPQKSYGTALVALCFVNYIFPVLGEG